MILTQELRDRTYWRGCGELSLEATDFPLLGGKVVCEALIFPLLALELKSSKEGGETQLVRSEVRTEGKQTSRKDGPR